MAEPEVPEVLGITDVDAEHSMQFRLITGIESAIAAGDRDAAISAVQQLHDFTEAHFGSEQVFMRLHAFPGHRMHELEHTQLLAELRELILNMRDCDPSELPGRASAIKQWLLSHIRTSDRAFATWTQKNATQR